MNVWVSIVSSMEIYDPVVLGSRVSLVDIGDVHLVVLQYVVGGILVLDDVLLYPI